MPGRSPSISPDRLRRALEAAAIVAERDGRSFPRSVSQAFARLEAEVDRAAAAERMLERARVIAQRTRRRDGARSRHMAD